MANVFAAKIRSRRKALGLTQAELAREFNTHPPRLKIAKQTIGAYESGRINPSPERAAKLVDVLEIIRQRRQAELSGLW
jgi:transcriptional regulator with XRE-family HTH domain